MASNKKNKNKKKNRPAVGNSAAGSNNINGKYEPSANASVEQIKKKKQLAEKQRIKEKHRMQRMEEISAVADNKSGKVLMADKNDSDKIKNLHSKKETEAITNPTIRVNQSVERIPEIKANPHVNGNQSVERIPEIKANPHVSENQSRERIPEIKTNSTVSENKNVGSNTEIKANPPVSENQSVERIPKIKTNPTVSKNQSKEKIAEEKDNTNIIKNNKTADKKNGKKKIKKSSKNNYKGKVKSKNKRKKISLKKKLKIIREKYNVTKIISAFTALLVLTGAIILSISLLITSAVNNAAIPQSVRDAEYNGRTESDSVASSSTLSSEQQDKLAKSMKVKGKKRAFKFYADEAFAVDEYQNPALLEFGNPKSNNCVLVATIIDENGNELYKSLGVKPGKTIKTINMYTEIGYGKHECILVVNGYDLKTYKKIGTQYIKIQVNVGVDNGEE